MILNTANSTKLQRRKTHVLQSHLTKLMSHIAAVLTPVSNKVVRHMSYEVTINVDNTFVRHMSDTFDIDLLVAFYRNMQYHT